MVKEKPVTKSKKAERTNEQVIDDWIGSVKKLHQIRHTNVYGSRYRTDVFTYYRENEEDLFYQYVISQSYFVAVVNGEVVNLTQTVEPEDKK